MQNCKKIYYIKQKKFDFVLNKLKMTRYSSIKKSIDWIEKFENQLTGDEIWDDKKFADWLVKELGAKDEPIAVEKTKSNPKIMLNIFFMYKYASFYSRKIFKNSVIYSIDDFSFLASLLPDKKMRKADVIRKNVAEKSSGNEVLKRLLKQNLIKETDNPADKRSKLLEITPQGFKEIDAIRNQMFNMAALVDGNLTEEEKSNMLNMLAKLNDFHRPIFDLNDENFINQKLGI